MSSRGSRGSSFSGPTRVIFGLLAVLTVVYAAFGFRAWLRKQETLAEVERLGAVVLQARTDAESCTSQLALDESVFERTNQALDSLRNEVEGAEQALPDGTRTVDADEYDAYMESFREYNRSVDEWEAQAEGLRAREDRCRALVGFHNVMADSLRRFIQRTGVELR